MNYEISTIRAEYVQTQLKIISAMAVQNWSLNGFRGQAQCELVQEPREKIKQILGVQAKIWK